MVTGCRGDKRKWVRDTCAQNLIASIFEQINLVKNETEIWPESQGTSLPRHHHALQGEVAHQWVGGGTTTKGLARAPILLRAFLKGSEVILSLSHSIQNNS